MRRSRGPVGRKGLWLWSALVLAVAIGCHKRAPEEPKPPPTTSISGLYRMSFEASWLAPCGTAPKDSLWWVTLSTAALRQRDSIAAQAKVAARGPVFLIGRGSISEPMQAGMMGKGTRYVFIDEITELRPAGALPCAGR